jgi:hypothetical protein
MVYLAALSFDGREVAFIPLGHTLGEGVAYGMGKAISLVQAMGCRKTIKSNTNIIEIVREDQERSNAYCGKVAYTSFTTRKLEALQGTIKSNTSKTALPKYGNIRCTGALRKGESISVCQPGTRKQ